MKSIEVDDDLYAYIASQTKDIGESASDILRRLLLQENSKTAVVSEPVKAEVSDNVAVKPNPRPAAKVPAKKVTNKQTITGAGLLERVTEEAVKAFEKKVDKFLFVLTQLHHIHGDGFSAIQEIRGKDRLYFAQSEAELTATGKSTNPKQIPDSPFWVVTNNNSDKKTRLLKQALTLFGYNESDIETVLDIINQ